MVVEPHRHGGVFIAKGKEDALCTRNMNPGKQVYGEKLVKVDVSNDKRKKSSTLNPYFFPITGKNRIRGIFQRRVLLFI